MAARKRLYGIFEVRTRLGKRHYTRLYASLAFPLPAARRFWQGRLLMGGTELRPLKRNDLYSTN